MIKLKSNEVISKLFTVYNDYAVSIDEDLKVACCDRAIELHNELAIKSKEPEAEALFLTYEHKYHLIVLPEKFDMDTFIHELEHFYLKSISYSLLADKIYDSNKIFNIAVIPDLHFEDDYVQDHNTLEKYNYGYN
jgi:hypothetical protein